MENPLTDQELLEAKEQKVLLDKGERFTVGRRTFKIYQPYLSTLDMLDEQYRKIEFDRSKFSDDAHYMDIFNEQRRLVKPNARVCAMICAIAVLNSRLKVLLFGRLLAMYFYHNLKPAKLIHITNIILKVSNLSDFTNSIVFLSLQPRATAPQTIEKEA